MTVYSLFMGEQLIAFKDDVDLPALSRDAESFRNSQQLNILYHLKQEVTLNQGGTYTLSLAGAAQSAWEVVLFRVRNATPGVLGSARLDLTGYAADGVTAITGKLAMQGMDPLPGIGYISTTNVTQVVVESLAAGTVVEIFYGVACADNDARLVTNA